MPQITKALSVYQLLWSQALQLGIWTMRLSSLIL